ncbi:MAG: hypothetical protein KatS3mg129_1439 [Leptospiraceae bacterium]|nr:MAG: hypothetical protein KatS3mg129_1439 [Leptospiraceae bacterium]
MIDDLIGIKKNDKNTGLMLALWQHLQTQYQGTGTVSADIGPSGGSLTDKSGNYILNIPEGALENNQTIRMTVLNSETYDTFAPATPKIVLEPHGLQFKKPVELKLKFGNEHTSRFAKDLSNIYYINEVSGKFERLETTQSLDGNYLIAKLDHFSLYAGLYLRIEDVVNDVITNPLDIQNIVLEIRSYLQGWGSIARRNYFYSFYQPTLLPFLIRANRVYPPGNNPLLNTFPNDDFDSDGIINSSDTYPFDPTNNGDETPPIVVSVIPNGSNIPTTPGTIRVTFNERVSPPTLQYAIRLFDGEREYYVNFESLDTSGTVATFRYDYNLESAKTYTIRIEGVTDIFGNRMYGIQNIATITTVDTGQPKIIAMSPSGWDVPQSTNQITLTFNEAIDPSTLNGFSLKGYGNPTLTFQSISVDQKTAVFSIDSNLMDSGYYFLNIPSTVKDLAGNPIEIPPYFWMFQVEDHTAPSVYKVEPSGNAVNPDTPGQIVLYFTEPVNETSIQNAVELIGGDQTPPSVTFDRTEQYGTVAYFNINGSLQQKTNYTIRIKEGISDLKGNVSSVPIDFNFKSGDTIPPVVVNVSPQGLNIGFQNDLNIIVEFNEEMDPYSLSNALQITDSNGIVPYIFLGYDEYTDYSYYPYKRYIAYYRISKNNLSEYMPYMISISGAKDVYGNTIQPNLYAQFRTASSDRLQRTNYVVSECNNKVQIKIDYNRELLPEIKDEYNRDRSLDQSINVNYRYYIKVRYQKPGVYNVCTFQNPDWEFWAALCAFWNPNACWIAWNTPQFVTRQDPKCGLYTFYDVYGDRYDYIYLDRDPYGNPIYSPQYENKILKFKYFTNSNTTTIYEATTEGTIPTGFGRYNETYIHVSNLPYSKYPGQQGYFLLKDLNLQYELPHFYIIQDIRNKQSNCY